MLPFLVSCPARETPLPPEGRGRLTSKRFLLLWGMLIPFVNILPIWAGFCILRYRTLPSYSVILGGGEHETELASHKTHEGSQWLVRSTI